MFNNKKLGLCISIFLMLLFVSPAWSQSNTDDSLKINSDGSKTVEANGITFTWFIDGDYIYGTLTSPLKGWVAIGIEPEKMMLNADYIIAYVKDGVAEIRDDYGNGRLSHLEDTKLGGVSNLELLSGSESDNGTIIKFRRKLNTGDEYDKKIVEGREVKLIFAASSKDNFRAIHKIKGKALIKF